MLNKKIILVLIGLLLTTTLTACNTESSINEAKGEAAEINVKSANQVSQDEDKIGRASCRERV